MTMGSFNREAQPLKEGGRDKSSEDIFHIIGINILKLSKLNIFFCSVKGLTPSVGPLLICKLLMTI